MRIYNICMKIMLVLLTLSCDSLQWLGPNESGPYKVGSVEDPHSHNGVNNKGGPHRKNSSKNKSGHHNHHKEVLPFGFGWFRIFRTDKHFRIWMFHEKILNRR